MSKYEIGDRFIVEITDCIDNIDVIDRKIEELSL